MTVIYDQLGRPAATISSSALFNADGEQTAFVEEGLIFSMTDGEFWGSYSNGVVYSSEGQAEGFSKNAKPGPSLHAPRLRTLPPRLKTISESVRHLPTFQPPEFFSKAVANKKSTLDGILS